jgi:predicted O-methyltransferase YrrM
MPSVHRQTFTALVKASGWKRGAELGVDKAILTAMLLRECPRLEQLIAVDIFPNLKRSNQAFELEKQYPERLDLFMGTTNHSSLNIEDGSLDFVFIDADHSYDSVKDDIARWAPKVRTGGWVGGHDYHPRKWPGVVKAVDEAFGRSVHQMPGTIWGVWK